MIDDPHGQAPPGRVQVAWAATGALTVILFAGGLVFGDLLGTTNFPPLNATAAALRRYFERNVTEVRALSLFHLLAAVTLAAFAAYLSVRLRDGGSRLAALALAGGILGAGFLALSALCYRVLAEPAVLGLASAATMAGPTNNSSALYGLLLIAAVVLFAWLVATSAALVRALS
jgi:hypothetical protein